MDALRHGRVVVSESPTAARLYLSVKGARPGDTASITPDGAPVTVRVVGGRGLTARIVWPDGHLEVPATTDDFTMERAISLDLARPAYVRAELRYPDGRMCALTNPVWVVKG
jgi:hypothetical protein